MTTTKVEPVVDAEIADLDEREAAAITSRIRTWVKACPVEDVKRAYFGRIWLAMGYESWAEWCDCELDGFKLPMLERREVVGELAESGMSNRGIADVVGIDRKTVRKDIAEQVGESGPLDPDGKIIGQDGKTYKRKPKPQPKPPLTDLHVTALQVLSNTFDHWTDAELNRAVSEADPSAAVADLAQAAISRSGDKPSAGEVVDPEPVPDCAAAAFAAALRDLRRRLDNIKINATLEQIKEVQTLLYKQAGSLRWHESKLRRQRCEAASTG